MVGGRLSSVGTWPVECVGLHTSSTGPIRLQNCSNFFFVNLTVNNMIDYVNHKRYKIIKTKTVKLVQNGFGTNGRVTVCMLPKFSPDKSTSFRRTCGSRRCPKSSGVGTMMSIWQLSDNRVEFTPTPFPRSFTFLTHTCTQVHGFFSEPNPHPCGGFWTTYWDYSGSDDDSFPLSSTWSRLKTFPRSQVT